MLKFGWGTRNRPGPVANPPVTQQQPGHHQRGFWIRQRSPPLLDCSMRRAPPSSSGKRPAHRICLPRCGSMLRHNRLVTAVLQVGREEDFRPGDGACRAPALGSSIVTWPWAASMARRDLMGCRFGTRINCVRFLTDPNWKRGDQHGDRVQGRSRKS